MGPCASSTLKGLVPRRSATDGWPVGSLRRGASVQGLAGIVGAHVRFGGREVRCAADMSQVSTGGLRNIRRACSTSMGRWLGNGSLRTAVQGCRRWRTGCCRPRGPSHGCRKRRPPRPSCFRCPASAPACWPLYLPRVATRCGGGTTNALRCLCGVAPVTRLRARVCLSRAVWPPTIACGMLRNGTYFDRHRVNGTTLRPRATPSLHAQVSRESKRAAKRRLQNGEESFCVIEISGGRVIPAPRLR